MSSIIKDSKRIYTGGVDVTSLGSGVTSIIAGTKISISPGNGIGNVTINTIADNITVVANFSALPAVGTVTGQFFWAKASQGTKWLPGALGGTYYSAGMYYSNGVSYEFMDVPYQATQAEVNTGTNTDKFVTPSTLTNWSKLISYNGVTTELVVSDTTITVNIGGVTYKLLAKA